ncbi:MAG TPA: DNA/RNA helicase domain-containing protein, partial [Dongiaceae bacterium]|nr:DNA/RNA helicase domain-containing protein [Dongiaceae bacterium]
MTSEVEPETQTVVNEDALPVESWVNQAEAGQDMLTMILSFLQVPGHVLLIQGAPGTGKTTLALEILRRLVER